MSRAPRRSRTELAVESSRQVSQLAAMEELANQSLEVRRTAQLRKLVNARGAQPQAVTQAMFETGIAEERTFSAIGEVYALHHDYIRGGDGLWAQRAFETLQASILRRFQELPPVSLMSYEELVKTKEEMEDTAPEAFFDQESWEMFIDPDLYLQPFSEGRFAKLSGVLLHELRHADQTFRAARAAAQDLSPRDPFLEQRYPDPSVIAEDLGIPIYIADHAVKVAGASPLEGKELGEGRAFRTLDARSKEANLKVRIAEAALTVKAQDFSQLSDQKELLMAQINNLLEQDRRTSLDESDQQTLRGLAEELALLEQKIGVATDELIAAQEERNQLREAYENDPLELDARALGDRFEQGLRAQQVALRPFFSGQRNIGLYRPDTTRLDKLFK